MNSDYSPDTVRVNHVQFWFRRFRFSNFEEATRFEKLIVESNDKVLLTLLWSTTVQTVTKPGLTVWKILLRV